MADLCDPGLLLSLAEAGYNVHELRISMMGGAVTVDSIREAVALGIDPNAVAGWVATGRPGPSLPGRSPRSLA
jgi:hypothetical protein